MEEKKKRERGANYTPEEKSLLADLVFQYKHFVEDKRTDGISLAKKKETWLIIASKYNSCASSGHRSVEQLRILYDNWKQKTRKNVAGSNIQTLKTREVPYQSQTTDYDEKLISIKKEKIEPLPIEFDSGVAYFRDNKRIVEKKKNMSAECFKRIYFKRKCQVANLEKKKLMQEILQQRQQHNLKMQILKQKLNKNNTTYSS